MPSSVERIVQADGAMKTLIATIREGVQFTFDLPLTTAGPRRILRWGVYMPRAAQCAADTLELAKDALKGMPLTAENLRNLNEQVRTDETIMMRLEGAFTVMRDRHQQRKDLLCKATTLVVDTITAHIDNPCTPSDVRELLEGQGRTLLQIITEYNESLQQQKGLLQRLRAEGAEAVADAKAEAAAATATASVLRGRDLPPQAQPAGPQRRGMHR